MRTCGRFDQLLVATDLVTPQLSKKVFLLPKQTPTPPVTLERPPQVHVTVLSKHTDLRLKREASVRGRTTPPGCRRSSVHQGLQVRQAAEPQVQQHLSVGFTLKHQKAPRFLRLCKVRLSDVCLQSTTFFTPGGRFIAQNPPPHTVLRVQAAGITWGSLRRDATPPPPSDRRRTKLSAWIPGRVYLKTQNARKLKKTDLDQH